MLILAIHTDSFFVRAALVKKNRSGIKIRSLHVATLSSPDDVKQLYIKNESSSKNFFFKGHIVSGLVSKNLLIRSIEMKIPGKRHTEEAIAFHSDATTHFEPDTMVTVPLLKKMENGLTSALLFTAPKEAVADHLEQLKNLDVDPDQVSAVPIALCRYVNWKLPHLSEALIIDLGMSEWSCLLMENRELKKAYSLSEGIESLFSALSEDRKRTLLVKEIESTAKQIDLLLIKPHLNPRLTKQLNHLRHELFRGIRSFQKEGRKYPIIFTGQTDAFLHLQDFLVEEHIPIDETEELKFGAAIGLALESSIQFRKEEFFPLKNWKKMGIRALALLITSVTLSAVLVGAGLYSSNMRKQEMVATLSQGKGKVSLSELSNDEKINHWITSIEKSNKEYPFIFRAPKVAELLSWISSNNLLKRLREEGDPIDIREIQYELLSFPKIGALREPYLVKVEIEFGFKEALNARKFHEILLEGDTFVDSSQEVTWEPIQDGYRTSFFLKNRGQYVPRKMR